MAENPYNIVIIRPPMVVSKGTISSRTLSLFLPLGIAYLAAYIRERGFKVSVIDAFGEAPVDRTVYNDFDIIGLTIESIIERLPSNVDVIGLSCTFSNDWPYARELMLNVRKAYSAAVLVIGGEHPRALPEYTLEDCQALDYLIYGEGEEPFYQLLKCLISGEQVSSIPGVVCREKNGISEIIPSNRIKAIDDLPLPAWDLLPVENFLSRGLCYLPNPSRRFMPVSTSRGCPYTCKFCTAAGMWGKQYNQRSPEKVFSEIKLHKDRYGLNGFDISDLTFMGNRNWIVRFFELLISEKLELEWCMISTRSELIDEELARLLKKSGCIMVSVTPDSGSKKQLKEMQKRVDLNHIKMVVRALIKEDINIRVNLVFAFPNETHWSILQTFYYGFKLAWAGVQSIFFIKFVPYPGSEYFELCRARGQIPQIGQAFDHFLTSNVTGELKEVHSYSPYVSDKAVKRYIYLGTILSQMIFMMRHPWRFLRVLLKGCRNQSDEPIAQAFVASLSRLGIKF